MTLADGSFIKSQTIQRVCENIIFIVILYNLLERIVIQGKIYTFHVYEQ